MGKLLIRTIDIDGWEQAFWEVITCDWPTMGYFAAVKHYPDHNMEYLMDSLLIYGNTKDRED